MMALKQQLIVYSGGVKIVDYPSVVIRENILVKPLYVYIGELEQNILEGKIPVLKPIVLGSSGVVKVIEVFNNHTELTGKTYAVTPLGEKGVLGLDEDGILASYKSIHFSYIDDEIVNPSPLDAIRPLIKHASGLTYYASEPILIEGCGIIGLITGLILRRIGIEPVFYCIESRRRIQVHGFNAISNLGDLNRKWNTVILTSTSIASKHRIVSELDFNRLVISRLSLTTWIPIKNSLSRTEVIVVDKGISPEKDHVVHVFNEIGKRIKIHNINSLENVIGLLPPRSLGTILAFTREL